MKNTNLNLTGNSQGLGMNNPTTISVAPRTKEYILNPSAPVAKRRLI